LPISHPFIYSVYLSKLLGSFITLGEANDTWALNEGALKEAAFLELTYSNHKEWEEMFFNALAKTKRGTVICVFETTDSIQHMFWRYLDKSHRLGDPAGAQDRSSIIYKKMDDLVGRVRRARFLTPSSSVSTTAVVRRPQPVFTVTSYGGKQPREVQAVGNDQPCAGSGLISIVKAEWRHRNGEESAPAGTMSKPRGSGRGRRA
jgi:hypothetical protein